MLRQDSTATLVEEVPEAPFYIPGTGSSTRPRRTLKHGDCFVVLDSHADIGATPGGPDGIFFCDTRYLSQLEMLLNGQQPLLLGSSVRDDNSILTVDLTNPDIYFDQKLALPKDMLHVVRTLFLWRGTAYQRLRMQNHGDLPFDVRLSLAFASDFADLFEVRGLRRLRRGTVAAEVSGEAEVALNYQGLDGNLRRTMLLFNPAPERLSISLASYAFTLQPNESTSVFVTVKCERGVEKSSPPPFRRGLRAAFDEHKIANRGIATVTSSNQVFNEVLCRSMADLSMLTTDTPQGPYPYAGIPWYSTTFGRDGIITALQMLWCDSRIAKGVLRRLAAYQARDFDPLADAEPGKIVHEMRERRDGDAARGSVRSVLRQCRFHAAVRDAGRALHRAHRRCRNSPRAMAEHRSGAGLDRRAGRSRSRRLRRISPRRRDGPGESGLEGLARRDLSRRWLDSAGADRALRGAGLRLCGEALGCSRRPSPR